MGSLSGGFLFIVFISSSEEPTPEVVDAGLVVSYLVVSLGPELSRAVATWLGYVFLAIPAKHV